MLESNRLLVASAVLIVVLAVAAPGFAGPMDAPGAPKALTCSICHGTAGNSLSDTMPILAGMPPAYFKKAVQDYASGKRPSPEMEPNSKMVLQVGVDEIAQYFASQKREPTPIKADPAAVARGKAASTQCVICHGPEGKGDPAKLIPDLRGQPPGYLRNQMILFKEDKRSPGDDVLKAVKVLMKTVPDETLADLAAYYSSLK